MIATVDLKKVRESDEERDSRRLLINFSEKDNKQTVEDIDVIQGSGFSLAGGLKKDCAALIAKYAEMVREQLNKAA